MHRIVSMIALMSTFAAAFSLYAVKYDTRQLQRQVHRQERMIQRFENEIIDMKAERAHLGRPQRIEELARQIGLMPTSPDQYGSIDDRRLGGTTIKHQRR